MEWWSILPKKERRSCGEWCQNHILPQHSKKWTDVALLDVFTNLYEVLRSEHVTKWEAAMQEKHNSLMANCYALLNENE